MLKIALAGQKGGIGKSTLSWLLVNAAGQRSARMAICCAHQSLPHATRWQPLSSSNWNNAMALNLKVLSCACLVMLAGISSGSTTTWETTNNKGLLIYIIGNSPTGKLTLVCDPESLWAAPEQGLKAQYSLSIDYKDTWVNSNSVTFSTGSYKQSVPITGGSYFRDNPVQWNELIKALQKPGVIAVSAGQNSFSIMNDKLLKSECIKAH